MKKSQIALACLSATCIACVAIGVADDARSTQNEMKKKLEYSKNILAGLTVEDFELITKNAEALNELGKKRWLKNESMDYRTQYLVFWFSNEALINAAKDRNIDGAALAYTQLTLSCINCHKEIRNKS